MLEPIVYLLAFGLGLGATLVNNVDGVPYIQFVGTRHGRHRGDLLQRAAGDVRHLRRAPLQNTYEAILAAPVDVEELVSAGRAVDRQPFRRLRLLPAAGHDGLRPLPAPGMLLVPLFCFVTALGFAGFGITTWRRPSATSTSSIT